jgi:hypothetical protein
MHLTEDLVETINQILVGGLGLLDPFLVTRLKIGLYAKDLELDVAERLQGKGYRFRQAADLSTWDILESHIK